MEKQKRALMVLIPLVVSLFIATQVAERWTQNAMGAEPEVGSVEEAVVSKPHVIVIEDSKSLLSSPISNGMEDHGWYSSPIEIPRVLEEEDTVDDTTIEEGIEEDVNAENTNEVTNETVEEPVKVDTPKDIQENAEKPVEEEKQVSSEVTSQSQDIYEEAAQEEEPNISESEDVEDVEVVENTEEETENEIAQEENEKEESETRKDDYDSYEVKLIASIIHCEAGNQCTAGRQAVGIVVMNRVADSEFPSSIESVIRQKKQFAPAGSGWFDRTLNNYSSDVEEEDIEAAKYALAGNKTVTYKGESYDMSGILYFNCSMSKYKYKIQDHYFR